MLLRDPERARRLRVVGEVIPGGLLLGRSHRLVERLLAIPPQLDEPVYVEIPMELAYDLGNDVAADAWCLRGYGRVNSRQ